MQRHTTHKKLWLSDILYRNNNKRNILSYQKIRFCLTFYLLKT
jgi:hypothetical protein